MVQLRRVDGLDEALATTAEDACNIAMPPELQKPERLSLLHPPLSHVLHHLLSGHRKVCRSSDGGGVRLRCVREAGGSAGEGSRADALQRVGRALLSVNAAGSSPPVHACCPA